MRGKFLIPAALAALLAGPALADCNLSMDARAVDLPTYVENGQACLAVIPEGYNWDEAFETEFARLINHERRENGLAELKIRTELQDAARWHSLDMAANDFFAHMAPDERMPLRRITAFDRTLLSSVQRENIAAIKGHYDPETVVRSLHDGLMDSPGHRKAILANDVTHLAVGVVRKPDGVWLTELFVKQDGSFLTAVPTQLEAGSLVEQPAELEGWTWSGLALRKDGKVNDLPARGEGTGRLPKDAAGTYAFTVRGEKPGPTKNSCTYMHFSGPRIDVVPPRAS